MKKVAAIFATIGIVSMAESVSAVQYTKWDFKNSIGSVSSPTDVTACGSFNSLACQVSLTIGGQTVLARAYSTRNDFTNTDKLQGATINKHSDSGLGVTNSTDGSALIDDSGKYDLIVFEASSADFKWTELELGFVNPTSTDIQAWVGNGASPAYDFTNLCLASNGSPCANSITNQFVSLGTFTDPGANNPINLNPGTKTGRYLVVSGALNAGMNDGFKIKSVKGTPEPQTLALLGLGFLGMVGFVRRKAVFS